MYSCWSLNVEMRSASPHKIIEKWTAPPLLHSIALVRGFLFVTERWSVPLLLLPSIPCNCPNEVKAWRCLAELQASGAGQAEIRASGGGPAELRVSCDGLVELKASGGGLVEL
ncbi:hypothetical protein KFK09_007773 [Dendrobium nobile]|uniref:Uncharacterized protein n=1 Tax=Dendrobium nobile TaxID=94219 RepID=A0A8T3BXF4_DENNO|nr:hypothetical protein KFK09_007773 [Dendrobium nobile]